MTLGKEIAIKDSIATRILFVVLGLYLAIAIVVGSGQLLANYQYQKASIIQDLGEIAKSFENGLAVSLWKLDEEALRASVEGMSRVPTVTGVTVVGTNGSRLAMIGVVVAEDGQATDVGTHISLLGLSQDKQEETVHRDKRSEYEVFQHTFPIIYTHNGTTSRVGHATVYSDSSVIYRRMRVELIMIGVSIVLTLVTFFLGLLWAVNRHLRRPLTILTKATAGISLGSLQEFSVDTRASGYNEIKQLERTMVSMVSELHEAVVLQKRSQELYRGLYEDNPSMYFKIGIDGTVLSVNQFGAERLGYAVDELVGESVLATYHPDDRDMVQRSMAECLEKPRNVMCWEFRKMCSDGTLMWAKESVRMIQETDGAQAVLMVCDDITARKQAENDLRESEERYSTVYSTAPLAFVLWDTDCRVIDWNDQAELIFGWSKEEVMGKRFFDFLIPEESRPTVEDVVAGLLRGSLQNESENLNLTKAGDMIRCQWYNSSQHDQEGNITGALSLALDITQRYETEEERKRLQDQLTQVQKMDAIGQLAGGVAHDFNNMLGGIVGAAELVDRKLPDDDPLKFYLDLIMTSADRAAELAAKLLAFARKQRQSSTPVDAHRIITDTVAILANTIDKRITISADLVAETHVVIGDSSQLQNVFMNLGINASHAMPKGGNLTFHSETIALDQVYCDKSPFKLVTGRYIKISVRDSGYGICPEDMSRIFEPFFTTKEQGKGTGLGLAATYGTIQQHNGAITVYSELGEGTCFQILLPLTESGIEEPVNGAFLHGCGLVLVVDDESVMRATAKAYLEEMGYDVMLAEEGEAAVALYRENWENIDIVICDMIMPKMNGRDCFRELKRINPKVRFILCSGFTRNEDTDQMKSEGLAGFIQKPFRGAELSRVVADSSAHTGE